MALSYNRTNARESATGSSTPGADGIGIPLGGTGFHAAAQRETQRSRRTFGGGFLRRNLSLKAPEKDERNLVASVSPVAPLREIRYRRPSPRVG
jgi:hypothetical protein